jgi:hypothetical protein
MFFLACTYCQPLHHVRVICGEFWQHTKFHDNQYDPLGATQMSELLQYRMGVEDTGEKNKDSLSDNLSQKKLRKCPPRCFVCCVMNDPNDKESKIM